MPVRAATDRLPPDPTHGPDRRLVCVLSACDRHPQHHGSGHCEGCIEDSNEGWDVWFTFDDEREPCCCRSVEDDA